jgi:DNA (cytosine-5)-methyltransferase 1
MGFDAEWGVLGAADLGASHQRDRIWIVANSRQIGLQGHQREQQVPKSKAAIRGLGRWKQSPNALPKPIGLRSLNGMANGVDRLKALGNGQVPRVAAAAFAELGTRYI